MYFHFLLKDLLLHLLSGKENHDYPVTGCHWLETIVLQSSHCTIEKFRTYGLQEEKLVRTFICKYEYLSLYYKLFCIKQPLED